MKCEDFWKKYPDYIKKEKMDVEMKEHLKNCNRCSEELYLLNFVFEELKQQMQQQQDFWIQLRENIKKEVKIPRKNFQWSFLNWNIGMITISILVILMIFKGIILDYNYYYNLSNLNLFYEEINTVNFEDILLSVDEDEEEFDDYYENEDWNSFFIEIFDIQEKGGELETSV